MGLDVYVGSLSRYYAGEWETIVQRMAREQGVPFRRIEATDPGGRPSVDDARSAILTWRDSLTKAVLGEGIVLMDWDESAEGECETDKPNWDCYIALLLFAAREEHPHARSPKSLFGMFRKKPQEWNEDPAYQASLGAGSKSRYGHLLGNTEFWLPYEENVIFEGPAPTGNQVMYGSSIVLLRQLEDLNARTWKASASVLAQWNENGADSESAAEDRARFAFALMYRLAGVAVARRLPMKLDY